MPVLAHPDFFADVRVNAVFNGKGLAGIHNFWSFDEEYSESTFASADKNGDGILSKKECEWLKKTVVDDLAKNNYHNYVLVSSDFIKAQKILNFKAFMENGHLVFDFLVEFTVPVTADYTMLVIVVNDQTNYMSMTTDMDSSGVEAPSNIVVEYFADNLDGLTLFRPFRSDIKGLFVRFKTK